LLHKAVTQILVHKKHNKTIFFLANRRNVINVVKLYPLSSSLKYQ
jgi:hypothetical protein